MAEIILEKETNGKLKKIAIDENSPQVKSAGGIGVVIANLTGQGWKRSGLIAPTPSPAAPVAAAAPEVAPQEPAAPEEETTLGGLMGAVTRGGFPVAVGAGLGGLVGLAGGGVGAVPGAIAGGAGAGALYQMLSDPAAALANWAQGEDKPLPSQQLESALTEAGVPEPKTAAERLVQRATAGATGALGGAGLGKTLAAGVSPLVTPTRLQSFGAALAEQPAAQAIAGATGGVTGGIAAEYGAGPVGQFLASMAGGLAGGAAANARAPMPTAARTPAEFAQSTPQRSLAVPPQASSFREFLANQLADMEKEATQKRLATAGPRLVKRTAESEIGLEPEEAARVMRETDMTGKGMRTAKKIAQRAEAVESGSGSVIGQIRADADREAGGFAQRADEARAAAADAQSRLAAKQAEIEAGRADAVRAAQEAEKNAAELEAAARVQTQAVEKQRAEFHKVSSATVPEARPLPTAAEEPGITRFSPTLVGAKEQTEAAALAEREAAKNVHTLKRVNRVIGSGPFEDPTSPQRKALWDLYAAEVRSMQAPEETAAAKYREKMLETVLGVSPPEPSDVGQLPMRSVVTAKKNLDVKQREADMAVAAAKRARDNAIKLAKDAEPTADQAAQLDALQKEINTHTETAAKHAGEASKRRVSGARIAARLRREAKNMLTSTEASSPDEITAQTAKAKYDKLIKAADSFDASGDISLEAAQERLRQLERDTQFERQAGDLQVAGAAQAAREQSRAIREGMDVAVQEALPLPSSSEAFASPYAAVGRGKNVEFPGGAESYQSARNVNRFAREIAESAGEEAARVNEIPWTKPLERLGATYGPSITAEMYEKAGPFGRRIAVPQAVRPIREDLLRTLPYGASSFEEALRQIDEESQQ